ncbi:MAG: YbjN domain-containing protein, partial [Verrucomicrobiales bacterium]
AAFEAHHAKVSLYAQTFEEMGAVSVVSEASLAATPAALGKVGEMLMRVNQQLTVGNFEMDWDQGMIYFRVTNVFAEPAAATAELLASLVRAAVVEMDRITPYLAVIARTSADEIGLLDIPALLAREDLLPDVGTPTP